MDSSQVLIEKMKESALKIVPLMFQQVVSTEVLPENSQDDPAFRERGVAGLIGVMSMFFSGYIAMNATGPVATLIASNMLGMDIKDIDDNVKDACGEMINIIAGNMKTNLSAKDVKFEITVPTIITGQNVTLSPSHEIHPVKLMFRTPAGPFYIEIAVKENG